MEKLTREQREQQVRQLADTLTDLTSWIDRMFPIEATRAEIVDRLQQEDKEFRAALDRVYGKKA